MLIESVGTGTKKKRTFQTALQASPALKALFNGDLDDKIRGLGTLAETAESTWWSMARTEFADSGFVNTTTATAAADAICAGAVKLMNQILTDIAAVTGATHTSPDDDLVWAVQVANPVNYDKYSLYAPSVTEVVTALLAKTESLRAMLSGVHDYTSYNAVRDNISPIYTWALQEFKKFGPHFPTVYTDYHSNYDLTKDDYFMPRFEAAIDDDSKLLVLTSYPDGKSGATAVEFQGGASGFHQLNDNDIVLLRRLEIEEYEDYVGRIFTVADQNKATYSLELKIGSLLFDEIIDLETSRATTFGENFELRKIQSA